MRAAVVEAFDGPEAVRVRDVEDPVPGSVLVDVAFAGVSFVDFLRTRGLYHDRPELPFALGMEFAGTVRTSAAGFEAGERVMGFVRSGAFAETVAADPALLFRVPDGLDLAAAAGVVLNAQTAGFALLQRGRLRAGETVLVHGAAGGVGTACVQLAAACGARPVGVVSSADKAETAERAGAAQVIVAADAARATDAIVAGDTRAAGAADAVGDDWSRDAARFCPGGYDAIVDPVGGDRFDESLRLLAPAGRLIVVGFASGGIPAVGANRVLFRNVDVVGAAWGEWLKRDASMPARVHAELEPHLRAGALDPVVDVVLGLDDVAVALARLRDRQARGKILLRVRG